MWKTGRERERVFKKLRLELESKTFETEVRAWVCNDHKEEKERTGDWKHWWWWWSKSRSVKCKLLSTMFLLITLVTSLPLWIGDKVVMMASLVRPKRAKVHSSTMMLLLLFLLMKLLYGLLGTPTKAHSYHNITALIIIIITISLQLTVFSKLLCCWRFSPKRRSIITVITVTILLVEESSPSPCPKQLTGGRFVLAKQLARVAVVQ